jgi:hypothetical protein
MANTPPSLSYRLDSVIAGYLHSWVFMGADHQPVFTSLFNGRPLAIGVAHPGTPLSPSRRARIHGSGANPTVTGLGIEKHQPPASQAGNAKRTTTRPPAHPRRGKRALFGAETDFDLAIMSGQRMVMIQRGGLRRHLGELGRRVCGPPIDTEARSADLPPSNRGQTT